MFKRKISLVAIVGAGLSGTGAAFLAFGPDLLVNFMSREDNRIRDEAALRQNELLERNALLMEGLADTLNQRVVEATSVAPPAPLPEPADRDTEQEPATAGDHEPEPMAEQPAPQPVAVAARGGSRTDLGRPAPTASAPAPVAEPAPIVSRAQADSIVSFGIYPGQTFDLCGYGNFTAEILTTDATARVSCAAPSAPFQAPGFAALKSNCHCAKRLSSGRAARSPSTCRKAPASRG